MSWHRKYWDSVDQFYWNPSLLGLPSIPKGEWIKEGDRISVPANRVQNGGSIYARRGTAKENAERMRRLEEPLNHIFEIAFGIAPDHVIEELILKPAGISDSGPFERLGREIAVRYTGFTDGNTTQQDGFFVSSSSAVGVELKLGSTTWPGQVLKYISLIVAEERRSGSRENVGLIFITPHPDASIVWEQCRAGPNGSIDPDYIERVPVSQTNAAIREMLTDHGEHFRSVADRLVMHHLSWSQFAAACWKVHLDASADGQRGETLSRLMKGLALAVAEQSGTAVHRDALACGLQKST
ncbi:hypothetical protein [Erythrobacter aurantius]|uniref:hypothetical protein n=1 Tax=Erythrobacter aurantius TaxID=2909249 RepID=UPI00207A404E|nr:hypothetical protein [Erythrobacter aurantius]